ncbi:hypothetical protein [Falsibacillus albus]|uniref:hypothetical protein n=1 Tax=Falsibacillus albus TaxID=2478915 RepID=UPI001313F3E9|nr:hypothetical protein [Falsibacillus albus]
MEDNKKFTADEVLKIISNKMENGQRWLLLNEMYDLYYNKSDKKVELEENY